MGSAFLVGEPRSAALRALNYTPELEAFRRCRGQGESLPLSSLVTAMGPAYGSVFVRNDCDPSHGVELVSQTDMFATEPKGRVIRRDSMAKPERHEIHRWQVLIAAAGTLGENELYGRSIIADERLIGKYVGPHAMVLTFAEPGNDVNLFTYAFLCTTTGVRALRSASYGTKILGIRKDVLGDLPIPLPDDATQKRVADLIRRTVECRERYAAELRAARAVVEDLPEMQEALAMCAERRGRCVLWDRELPTLSAWTYASTGGALGYLKRKWASRLGDFVGEKDIFYGGRFSRISCKPPYGINFLSQRDVFLIRPIPRRIVHPGVNDRFLFSPVGSLVMAGRGTFGEGEIFARPILVTPDLAQYGLTEDLLRILVEPGIGSLLYSFFATTVGFRFLRSSAVGTKIMNLRMRLLLDLPLPELTANQTNQARRQVARAIEARCNADSAEAEAIRIVEEEVLPSWLA